MKKSDSYLILEALIQKRLLVIKPVGLITWLNNLENTGQITEQESQHLLTLAEQLNIYNLALTECSFMLLSADVYLHPSTVNHSFRKQTLNQLPGQSVHLPIKRRYL